MTPNQYITENYDNIKQWLSGVSKSSTHQLFEDFIHEVIVIFLEHPKSQQAIDSDTARFFLVRIALNQWRSSTSPFAKQYKDSFLDYDEKIVYNIADNVKYDINEDMAIEAVMESLDALYQGNSTDRYDAIVILMYFSMGCNYSAVGRQIGIIHSTVRKIVLRGLEKIKSNIKKKINNGNLTINSDISSNWDMDGSGIEQQTISLATEILKHRYFNVA